MKIDNLEELFNECKKFKKILVTGPCRSGTTICAHILVDYLGLEFIESFPNYKDSEKDVKYMGSFEHLIGYYNSLDSFIAHGPHLHPFLRAVPEDILVVFMRRNMEDVLASTKKIKTKENGEWTDEFYSNHMRKIVKKKDQHIFDKMSYPGKTYYVWDNYQKQNINYVEVDYDLLASHHLFIPRGKRKNFRERQWNLK